jgi:hypothetical protein
MGLVPKLALLHRHPVLARRVARPMDPPVKGAGVWQQFHSGSPSPSLRAPYLRPIPGPAAERPSTAAEAVPKSH